MAKTSPNDFKVTTPETSLLSQQAITSKGILVPIPTYSCSIVTISPFDARLSST